MATSSDIHEGRLTLAKIHAVLCAVSVAMICQIASSANPVTANLKWAVWYFAASIILNAFFYVTETTYAPRFKSWPMIIALALLNSTAIVTTLAGVSSTISNVSAIAGLVFQITGVVLLLYLQVTISLHRLRPLESKLKEYSGIADEFGQHSAAAIQQLEGLRAEYDAADDSVIKQELSDRLGLKAAEMQQLSVEYEARMASCATELDRLKSDLTLFSPKVIQATANEEVSA